MPRSLYGIQPAALSVIPELRLTDRGLVDGLAMRIVPLF
jgi:adenine deaminase